jgi:BirA family biotin operon repressor/biotin-[acetyl-CoA-carboxylase] ligase
VRPQDLPPELRDRAGSLDREPEEVETVLAALLGGLERWLTASDDAVLDAVRARDALLDRTVRWAGGEGTGAGLDDAGRLLVQQPDGARVALDAGEVHLSR